MNGLLNRAGVAALALAGSLTAAGCDEFLDVKNPNNLEAEAIDEERDRAVLSQSAYQSLVSQYGTLVVDAAWFTHEARVGDTFPTRNEFGRRDLPLDGGENNGIWNTMHTNIQFAEQTIRSIEAAGNNIDLARAYFAAGFGIFLQAELFCEGTIAGPNLEPRGPMTTLQLLDSAIVRLQKASDIAKALTGTEASGLATASLVVIARAHLQAGRKAQASSVAAQVPSNFVFNFNHFDDPNNRGRLGNTIWSFSEARISLVVPPYFIAAADEGDPRLSYVDMGRPAQDGVLRFIRQNKYKGWGDPERVASGLEAQYIKIEADGDPAAMLAFVNARRAVGNQAPIAATTDMDVLLRALMDQKHRDFWLELKKMGDFRRNPNHVSEIIPTGNNYYKPEVGLVGTQTCWPVPGNEVRNNPKWSS